MLSTQGAYAYKPSARDGRDHFAGTGNAQVADRDAALPAGGHLSHWAEFWSNFGRAYGRERFEKRFHEWAAANPEEARLIAKDVAWVQRPWYSGSSSNAHLAGSSGGAAHVRMDANSL